MQKVRNDIEWNYDVRQALLALANRLRVAQVTRRCSSSPGGRAPPATSRTVFFHSALIQGVGSGLLAGKLADNDVLSGLKYSILPVALALFVSLFI